MNRFPSSSKPALDHSWHLSSSFLLKIFIPIAGSAKETYRKRDDNTTHQSQQFPELKFSHKNFEEFQDTKNAENLRPILLKRFIQKK